MQFVSIEEILFEMSNPFFWENKKNITIYCLFKFLPIMLSVK